MKGRNLVFFWAHSPADRFPGQYSGCRSGFLPVRILDFCNASGLPVGFRKRSPALFPEPLPWSAEKKILLLFPRQALCAMDLKMDLSWSLCFGIDRQRIRFQLRAFQRKGGCSSPAVSARASCPRLLWFSKGILCFLRSSRFHQLCFFTKGFIQFFHGKLLFPFCACALLFALCAHVPSAAGEALCACPVPAVLPCNGHAFPLQARRCHSRFFP